MRINVVILLCAIASAGGCLGDEGPLPGTDAGYMTVPDQSMASCTANNDGVIERSELALVVGVKVRYLQNPNGTVAQVDPVGQASVEGQAWDFTSTAGEAVELPILSVTGTWYETKFPGATYATYTDLPSKTLGVFRLTEAALEILGYVSEEPNKTLLIYDQPVTSLRFPARMGDAYTTIGHVTNGTFNNLPIAESDTYKVSIDERGVVVLPSLRVSNTLRVRVELEQALPGGVTNRTTQLLFFRECVGEVGRMVSKLNETNPEFTEAALFRRLAL